MLYSRARCTKVGYSYGLKFLAVNKNLVDRKQGIRFGQFLVCGLVKIHSKSPNRTLQTHQAVHHVSYRQNFHSLLETLDHRNSKLLHNGRVNKAYIFVISGVFTGTNLPFALLSQLFLCLQGTIR